MDTIDDSKIDEVALALMQLTLHDECRAWKGFDWDTLNRLHEKGLIANPRSRARSVVLTDEGPAESERLCAQYFASASEKAQ